MMAIGTRIVWTRHDNEDVTKLVIVRGTVTKAGRDTYYASDSRAESLCCLTLG